MRLTSALLKLTKEPATTPPLYILPLASGGAPYEEHSIKVIRFIRHGCTNRPFFHIAVQEGQEEQFGNVIEQLGTYDPLPNKHNEKLVAFNFIRIQHWLDRGAILSTPVKKLLGLAGYFPIHPKTYREAWLKRKMLKNALAELEVAEAAASASAASGTSGSDDKSEEPTS